MPPRAEHAPARCLTRRFGSPPSNRTIHVVTPIVRSLAFRVRPSSSFQRTLLDNQAFLRDYLAPCCPPVGEDDARQICEIVAHRIGSTLEDLIHATANPEAIYKMVASGALYVDLSRHFLSQPHLVLVLSDPASFPSARALLLTLLGSESICLEIRPGYSMMCLCAIARTVSASLLACSIASCKTQ